MAAVAPQGNYTFRGVQRNLKKKIAAMEEVKLHTPEYARIRDTSVLTVRLLTDLHLDSVGLRVFKPIVRVCRTSVSDDTEDAYIDYVRPGVAHTGSNEVARAQMEAFFNNRLRNIFAWIDTFRRNHGSVEFAGVWGAMGQLKGVIRVACPLISDGVGMDLPGEILPELA